MTRVQRYRYYVLAQTALAMAVVVPAQAWGQDSPADRGLEEIVVTAQKREQSLQDVPIAVTALAGDSLESNRVVSVSDLSGLAPGVTVRTSAGGQQLPSFSIRGVVSYGIVPGSDKQVSMYLDGVYISSPKGAIFDLPDVERIEMLRGPQGTLFGRNATAGAVSISTREPSGDPHVRQDFTISNQDGFRSRTSVDLPQIGPFSGYFSFVHDERHGDVRNAGAGQIWDRRVAAIPAVAKVLRSPKWMGSKNSDSWFAALKFEQGDFKTVYKYDRNENEPTPEATGLVALNPANAASGLIGALISTQPDPVNTAPDGKRPNVVNNAWSTPGITKNEGHSLTSTLRLNDQLTVKNIFGYRKSFLFATSSIDGLGALPITPAFASILNLPDSFIGSPFVTFGQHPEGTSKQISDEVQVNYDSDFLTATVGGIWFHSIDKTDYHNLRTISFRPILNGVIPQTNVGRNYNKATSIAGYAQLEFHVTQQLDIIAGGRLTQDKKSGSLTYGPNPETLSVLPFTYKDTRPSYLLGVNYKPSDDLLLYAKYSTAYVSGGSVGGVPFDPETAKSWEAGVKAEFLDRKVRTNLALYYVKYKNTQTSQTALNFVDYIIGLTGDPTRPAAIGTFIYPQGGSVKAKGFELDVAAAPLRGLSIGGNLAYNDTDFNNVDPDLIAASGGAYDERAYRPKWNGGVWAQYETPPLFGDATFFIRGDSTYQSSMIVTANPELVSTFAPAAAKVPAYWLINGRAALRNIDIGGIKTQVAVWGKNLTDEKKAGFSLNLANILAALNYIPARSYGVDFTIEF